MNENIKPSNESSAKNLILERESSKQRSKSAQPKCKTGAMLEERRSKSTPSRCAQRKALVGLNLKYTSDEI
jgi:hypothetical protein